MHPCPLSAAGCGADGVKVDVQGMVAHAGTATAGGGPALAAAYHASLEDSARAAFGSSAVINCMCGSTGECCVVVGCEIMVACLPVSMLVLEAAPSSTACAAAQASVNRCTFLCLSARLPCLVA